MLTSLFSPLQFVYVVIHLAKPNLMHLSLGNMYLSSRTTRIALQSRKLEPARTKYIVAPWWTVVTITITILTRLASHRCAVEVSTRASRFVQGLPWLT